MNAFRRLAILALGWSGLTNAPVAFAHDASHHVREKPVVVETVAVTPSPVTLIDQHGAPRTLQALLSEKRAVLLSFVFANCESQCPTTIEEVKEARLRLAELGVELRNITITVDPQNDKPENLAAKALEWSLDGEHVLLTGAVADVDVVLRGLGVRRLVSPTAQTTHDDPLLLRLPEATRFTMFGGGAGHRAVVDYVKARLAKLKPEQPRVAR